MDARSDGQGTDDPNVVKVWCIWREDYSPMSESIQNGRKFKCRSCYNSERFCQKKFKQDNKSHEWQGMTLEQKRQCILENRNTGQQGSKREYKVKEETNVKDSVKTGAQIPFLNKLEFDNLCRQRWGLTDQEVDDRWNTGLADVNVPKGTDEEGWTTMAKYALHSLESSRELSHGRHISKSDQVEAEPHQLRNIAGNLLQHGQLQSDTGVFDVGALPNLPGLTALARKPKAKAKPKGKGKAKARAMKDMRHDDDDIQSVHSVIVQKGKNGEFPGGQQSSEALRRAIGLVHQTETKEKWVKIGVQLLQETHLALVAASDFDTHVLLREMMPDAKSKVINMLSMLPPLLESDIAGEGDDREHHEWLGSFLEEIMNKRECLSPRSKQLSSKVFGTDVLAAEDVMTTFDASMKSLHQACKKATNSLVKHTNRIKQEHSKKSVKKQQQEEKNRREQLQDMTIHPDEFDFETGPVVRGWLLHKDFLQGESSSQIVRVSCRTDKSSLVPGEERLDLCHSECIIFDDDDVPDFFQKVMQEILPEAEKICPNDTGAYAKLQKRIGFPDFQDILNTSMGSHMEHFSWALSKYLRNASHRTKHLDKIFEMVVVPGGMQSTFVGPTDFLFPRFQLALQGDRFVVAVHIEKLAVLYTKVMKKHPVDILDFIEFVQKQSSSVLRQADAVWASLRPGSAMILPPGWFVSEGNPDHGVSVYAQCVCGSESQIRGFEVDLKDFWLNLTTTNKLLAPITSSITHGFSLRERLLMSNEGHQLIVKPMQEEAKKNKTREHMDNKKRKDHDKSRRHAGHAGDGVGEINANDKTNDQPMQSNEKHDKDEEQMEPQAKEQSDMDDLESNMHGALTQDQKQHCNMDDLSDDKQESTLAAKPEVTTTLQPPQNGAHSSKRNGILLAIEDIKPEAAAATSAIEVSTAATNAADMEQPSAETLVPHAAEMELVQTDQHDEKQQAAEADIQQNEQPSVETAIQQKETLAPASTTEDSTDSQPSHNKDGNLQPTEGKHVEAQNTSAHAAEPHDSTMSWQAADAAVGCRHNDVIDTPTPAPPHGETCKHETHPAATAGDENQVESKADAAPATPAATTAEALSEPAQSSNANIPEVLTSRPTPEAKATAKHAKKNKNTLPGPSLPLDSHPDNVRKYVNTYFKSPVPEASTLSAPSREVPEDAPMIVSDDDNGAAEDVPMETKDDELSTKMEMDSSHTGEIPSVDLVRINKENQPPTSDRKRIGDEDRPPTPNRSSKRARTRHVLEQQEDLTQRDYTTRGPTRRMRGKASVDGASFTPLLPPGDASAARPKRAASKEDKVIAAVAKLQAETKKLFKDDPHLAELKKASENKRARGRGRARGR